VVCSVTLRRLESDSSVEQQLVEVPDLVEAGVVTLEGHRNSLRHRSAGDLAALNSSIPSRPVKAIERPEDRC
jgi:hypothetical protein